MTFLFKSVVLSLTFQLLPNCHSSTSVLHFTVQSKVMARRAKNPRRITVASKFMEELCMNTSLHGLNQVMKPVFTLREKIMWLSFFLIAVICAGFSSYSTWIRYSQSTTKTTIVTTHYPIYEIPYPSIIICDKSTVDWERALALGPADLPPPFEVVRNKTLIFLKRMGYVHYGDFDILTEISLENETLAEIAEINVTALLLKVMRPCHEVFSTNCWFRDREYNCCSIFELQKTELGLCWAFNSDTSESSRWYSHGWLGKTDGWIDRNGTVRPRRTAQFGPWSGLRILIEVMSEENMPPGGNYSKRPGIYLIIKNPSAESFNGYTEVSPGWEAQVDLFGDSVIAKERVKVLYPNDRNCLFQNENYYNLPQGYYMTANCEASCYQNYTIAFCNCIPDMQFTIYDENEKGHQPCNASGLLCLSQFNDFLTYEKPMITSKYFATGKDGMRCGCFPDCTSHAYAAEMTAPKDGNNLDTTILLDVHFQKPARILYETDIVYDWLDVIVSFGGIAGLFLGASFISVVEFLYFFTGRLFTVWRSFRDRRPIHPFIH